MNRMASKVREWQRLDEKGLKEEQAELMIERMKLVSQLRAGVNNKAATLSKSVKKNIARVSTLLSEKRKEQKISIKNKEGKKR